MPLYGKKEMLIPPFIIDGQHRSWGFMFPSFRPLVKILFFIFFLIVHTYGNVSKRVMCHVGWMGPFSMV